jgi:hypothetical protein
MKHADFKIGLEFYTATGLWRCTDIGTRTIAAIDLHDGKDTRRDGPPYAVVEHVFDENDLPGCSIEAPHEEAIEE